MSAAENDINDFQITNGQERGERETLFAIMQMLTEQEIQEDLDTLCLNSTRNLNNNLNKNASNNNDKEQHPKDSIDWAIQVTREVNLAKWRRTVQLPQQLSTALEHEQLKVSSRIHHQLNN